jgi:hypothetical protein
MKREQVERLAREAGFRDNGGDGDWWSSSPDESLQRLCALAYAAAIEDALRACDSVRKVALEHQAVEMAVGCAECRDTVRKLAPQRGIYRANSETDGGAWPPY